MGITLPHVAEFQQNEWENAVLYKAVSVLSDLVHIR